MKQSLTSLAILMVVFAAGCNQGTPGGPGTTKTAKPAYGQADDTFNLSAPVMSSTLQRGDHSESHVGIARATNFSEDVALKFSNLPKGITVEPSHPVIKHGDTDAKITFTAADDTPLGDFKILVTGHPTHGSDAQIEFQLSVAAKDSFSLGITQPELLKQGETQMVSISITRDKHFDQDVAIQLGGMPRGVTAQPAFPVIKQGDAGAEVTLTAAEDASLGNFAIIVTGHPAQGVDALQQFKLTVAK